MPNVLVLVKLRFVSAYFYFCREQKNTKETILQQFFTLFSRNSAKKNPKGMTSLLKAVRKLRTFRPKEFAHRHPFAIYWTLCAALFSWANYAQYHRLAPMYPNFEEYRSREGGRMVDAKRQEFADVLRYNNMVSQMRSDLRK